MKYKLYSNELNTDNVIQHVLWNRGIKDSYTYLHLTEDVVNDYHNLDNIMDAVKCFNNHIENNDKISILVDVDPDGYTSAASMYLYIKRLNEFYPVEYIMHSAAKAHGLGDDIAIPEDTKLLIIPDAGTNDVEACKVLNQSMDVLILDHHELEEKNTLQIMENMLSLDSPYKTIIVNNQTSKNYRNKDLSGVGVVYRFLQALDDDLWNDFADDYLDLVALGNISDVMQMTSFETKYFVDKGLHHVNNKCIQALIKAQEFSMNGIVNIHNVQWYLTPILNGMIRCGSDEEKELLFRAFIEEDEFFEYNKRATKGKPAETIQESIYDRAARLCKNAKSRQDKIRDKSIAAITEEINKTLSSADKVVILDVSNLLENKGLTGVLAIKIAEMYNRPCLLLKKFINNEGKLAYGGSARNVDHSPVDSLKDIVSKTGVFNLAQGHANAFGLGLDLDKLDSARNALNLELQDVEYDTTYLVDYILDSLELNTDLPLEISKMENLIGQGINEPLVAIENIELTRKDILLFGKTSNTLAFTLPNGIKFVQFFCKEGVKLYDWYNKDWNENDSIIVTVVGKPGINEYQGIRTPQIVIEDVNILSEKKNQDAGTDFNDTDSAW